MLKMQNASAVAAPPRSAPPPAFSAASSPEAAARILPPAFPAPKYANEGPGTQNQELPLSSSAFRAAPSAFEDLFFAEDRISLCSLRHRLRCTREDLKAW